uniref:uncharacterized protein n=1 Tax=Centroberyx gerrardi TaxID=166262 RepID=UPI003AAAFE56
MDEPEKPEPQVTFEPADSIREAGSAASKCLEESGNCRQDINQDLNPHLLDDSLFTEQQKLRHALDWAHSFLDSGFAAKEEQKSSRGEGSSGRCQRSEEKSRGSRSFLEVLGKVKSLLVIADSWRGETKPAGVTVLTRWLCLPDEVWLSILSLLPHSGLSAAARVCHRLHRLATDHTLWKNLRIENCSSLTDRWFQIVGRRCPRRLSLYRCSGLSVTSSGLETFFSLSRNSLEELKVTSCSGPGLHGDLMLRLIGQLCDHVTSVDVSWSGATDTGVKALTDGCTGLRLETVVLNGCQVTDEPLTKLIMRHRESLCRLEVFGCQFLTPSCLLTVYELCPGLQHLNIGQVPKVNAHCLTLMTSQLKCLLSLNLTGLQALSDASVDKMLQDCVDLQSLTLSSCPGVTDQTLHNISTHTPCIRSLDVSGCKSVTDIGVQSVALGCKRLQHLDLSSTGTGNRGVTLLASYCSGHLHTVKLSFCHINPENILKLCRRCKRLKVLHLYGCAHIPSEREIREVNSTVKVYPLP